MTQQVTLKISAKNLDSKVNYINPKKQLNLNENMVNKVDFLLQTLQKEVKIATKQQKKQLTKVLKSTLATTASLLLFVSPTLAAPMNSPSPDIIMPADIMQFGMWVIGICAVLGFLLAIVCGQLAGGMRMLRRRKEATEWTTDIIKGFTQVMLAPVIVSLIALVCYLLFSNFQWFVSPF